MNEWEFDDTRFLEEVLKPVQEGWRPDEDLFRVYLLPHNVSDTHVVRAAVEEVGREFGKQRYRNFRRATEVLRAQHDLAAATLLNPARRESHRTQVVARAARLTEVVRQRTQGAPGLPPGELTTLARMLKVSRAAVVAALSGIGGRELSPIELPDSPEPRQWTEARGHLAQLRRDSLWDYMSELGGVKATTAALVGRRNKLRVSRSTDSAAETTLLKLVQQWIEGGDLVTVLRHELLSALGDQAAYSYADVARAARSASERLPALGVQADPGAVAYAVWCARRFGAVQDVPGWQENYQRAVRELRLRAALTVLQQQPALPDGWPEQLASLKARLSELDSELARCEALEATDVEAAVAGYHRVHAELADDRVSAALQRCRPAEPAKATARVQDGHVVVSWQPSRSTAGHITYRVTRGNTTVCEETDVLECVDHKPPNGVRLEYAVHTLRDGTPSAQPRRTKDVIVLGEVSGLELRGDPDRITGRWKLPDGSTGATVTRSGTAVRDATAESFTDKEVQPGRQYDYLVRVRYRLADGTTVHSDGCHATARCQEVPVGVNDLAAEFDDGELVAHWTPPPRGDVELLELRTGEDPPPPGVVSVTRARGHGTPVSESGSSGRGQLRGRVSVPGRRQVLLPITVLGDLAAIGAPCELYVQQSSVRAVKVHPMGTAIRLTWEWPPGVTSVRVLWRVNGKPTGPTDPESSFVDVTRVAYESRGISVPMPPGEYWLGVCTTATYDGERSFGPLLLRKGSASGTANYTVESVSRFSRRRRRLVIASEQEVPPVVLVAKSGVRPLDAGDGEVLLRVDGGPSPVSAEFQIPVHLRKPVHLRAFSADKRVVLVPSRPDRLTV